jgi:hypothetical protein
MENNFSSIQPITPTGTHKAPLFARREVSGTELSDFEKDQIRMDHVMLDVMHDQEIGGHDESE